MTKETIKKRVFAVYRKTEKGIMSLIDLVMMPEYYSPVRVKYELIESRVCSENIWVTFN